MAKRPEKTADALELIEEIGRTAQDELRVVLGLLRDEAAEPISRGPAPRLADLKGLVDTVRASGTQVELRMTGADRPLSPAIELSIYRVVQEALTNLVRHAPGAEAMVDLSISANDVSVEVTNNGGQSHDAVEEPPGAAGHGIVGMRERCRRLRRLALGRTPRRRWVPCVRPHSPGERSMTIRVVVVDDQELIRTAISSLINEEDDLEVVGQAEDGREAVELASRLSPDVVVMDVRMPGMDGIEATRRITSMSKANTPRVLNSHDVRPRRVRLRGAARQARAASP